MSAKTTTELPWGLITALATVGLIRPILGMLGIQRNFPDSPLPLLASLLVAALWVGVAVARRVPRPVITLTLAGGLHGVLVIALQQLVWDFPLPAAGYAGILLVNLLLGAGLGLIAATILRISSR